MAPAHQVKADATTILAIVLIAAGPIKADRRPVA
jgi:hypothetical protein